MPDQASGGATQAAQVPPTRATGAGSATGTAIDAQTKDIPTGEDRGSTVPIVGGEPAPDSERPEPVGAQVEPARFTSNGQLPHNSVPSPTGSLPVGAVATSQAHADKLVAQTNEAHDSYVARKRKRLDANTVRRLSRAELQAIAEQRGYNLPPGGNKISRDAFLQEQDSDEQLARAGDQAGEE